MKIRINESILRELRPCRDRFDNYLEHYPDFDGDILEFLAFDKITPRDKIWVSVRVMPRFLVEVFAVDCAVNAAYAADAADAAADAAYVADAAYAAAYAADAADAAAYAADAADAAYAERERQVDAIAYLVERR